MIQKTMSKAGSKRLVVLIKTAYWAALIIIAATSTASYLFLQQMLSAQQTDSYLLGLAAQQKALSQRIVLLATSTPTADPDSRVRLSAALEEATGTFEKNYDRIYDLVGADASAGDVAEANSINNILFAKPHHLDYFSTTLAANGHRFASAMMSTPGVPDSQDGYRGDPVRAKLDEKVATTTLEGYQALGDSLTELGQARLSRLANLHRALFVSTIGVILMIAVFIFLPLSRMVGRRTDELVEARNAMAHIASHDGLTGLYNRAYLKDTIADHVAKAASEDRRLAVIQFDLDNFKPINDTLGHAAGDHFLVTIAERLRSTANASDLCLRIGGDEFMMVCEEAADRAAVEQTVERVLSAINLPMTFGGTTLQSSSSAGVAIFPDDATNPADLFVYADLALYAAKDLGGGRVTFFNDALRLDLENRKRLEADLKLATAAEAFDVYFQPQVSLTTSLVTGVEALVRWHHAERGMVSPGAFIPVAEKCGLMPAIGRIVARKAIREAASWHREGLEFKRLAINASGSELRADGYHAFILKTLEQEGLPSSKLAIEIVESVILDDERDGIAETLRRIRAAGIHLELDDFGTGYASLSHVSPNEIDRLKIDRRFVQNIDANADNGLIVKAITDLARGMGISIVAEGAETADELTTLAALGCDQVQGYSIAYPMPDKAVRDWMVSRDPQRQKLSVISNRRA